MPKSRIFRMLVCVSLLAGLAGAAQVPRQAPEFTIHLTGGKQIQLSQYRGKVVALAFILTYCPHCQKTVGYLSTLQNEYGPRGFTVLASAIEDMAAMAVPDFIKRFQPPFPVGFNERNPVLEFLQHPSMFRLMMPQVVFIDRTGMIRAQYSGEDKFFGDDQEKNLREQIESLLKEGQAAQRKHSGTAGRKKAS
jgi:peroxiredoxin